MERQDLHALSRISKALWSNDRYCEAISMETLAAVSLLNLPDNETVDKTLVALLERANRDGLAKNESALSRPFFRLLPEERFILTALSLGSWSYRHIGRLLDLREDQVEEIAWNARLVLATQTQENLINFSGASVATSSCPDYLPNRPWTQRFLDDEIDSRQRLFIQNHLMACSNCRKALNRCRDLYYKVEAVLAKETEAVSEEKAESTEKKLYSAVKKTRRTVYPETFLDSLIIFFSRNDIRWFLLIAGAVLAIKIF